MSKEEAGSAPDPGLPTTVYTVSPETSVLAVAQLMVAQDIGAVLVVEDGRPIGIVTDRDIVVRVTATGALEKAVPVRNIMSASPVVVRADEEVSAAIALMGRHGIRRLPIVDAKGRLVSILTLDDILLLGLDGRQDLSDILKRQLRPQAMPPRLDIPATPPVATVAPLSPQPPPVLQAPLPEVRGASPVAAALHSQLAAQSVAAPSVIVQPASVPSMKGSGPRPEPARPVVKLPDHLSMSGSEVSPEEVRFSQPVTAVARTTIIRPLEPYHKTRLEFVFTRFFGNWGWLEVMVWLVAVGVLLSVLAHFAMESGWLTIKRNSYEPKDEERRQYLERLEKERSEANPPR
nr:CBS domain-containing protein [Nitrospirota bacterium]